MHQWTRIIFLFVLCFLFIEKASAQRDAIRGWGFLSHKQSLSKKWDLLADFQLRSADQFNYLTTILARTALSYNLNKKHTVALGYTFKPDWLREPGESGYQPEHRVFEQYLFTTKIKRTELVGRFRFEQRFVQPKEAFLFSQRARGFLSLQLPLLANANFSKGVYASLQNEVFVTVQNKQNVNNSFFDQNRLQGGLGYRWSKKVDTDINYMYWRHVESSGYQTSHVIVLMVTTEF